MTAQLAISFAAPQSERDMMVPDLARLYSLMWPERRGLFEFREHKAAA